MKITNDEIIKIKENIYGCIITDYAVNGKTYQDIETLEENEAPVDGAYVEIAINEEENQIDVFWNLNNTDWGTIYEADTIENWMD